MKVYPDTHTKDVKCYVLYADSDSYLYHDAAKNEAVTAKDLETMFYVGVFVDVTGVITAVDSLSPSSAEADYASVAIGNTSYYSSEYNPSPVT